MVLTNAELIDALRNEVRIPLHLAGKVDRARLHYRPTPKQCSTIELLRYLSMMGPTLVRYPKGDMTDPSLWMTAADEAERRDFDRTLAAIARQPEEYASLLADFSDAEPRGEINGGDGTAITRGAFLLFLYLKACGREDLSTGDLWAGIDAPAAAARA